ncbi:maleylpyruvate isomerase family mycothiol-dependent enzyme [Streptomyces sp. TRM70350]|nr:maleylpyruvate isomerase family mycothiol-dependent enzyme [Streptomyces sp. TRM70350]
MKEMPATPAAFAELAAAADRLLADIDQLTDADVTAPSALHGWSRGHVLSHLAAQASALERLLDWARTGVENPQYASREARDAEIEAGARGTAAELATRVRKAAAGFRRSIEELPEAAWRAVVRPFTGELCTPQRILVIRLRELEVHHVDLAVGYTFVDIPPSAREIILADVAGYLAQTPGMPDLELRDATGESVHTFGGGHPERPVVTGSRADLLAWLAGRSPGTGLATHDSGPLPELPRWI